MNKEKNAPKENHRVGTVGASYPVRKKQKKCPLLHLPLDDCYCSNINSLNAEAAIYYCGAHYEKCEIYKAHKKRIMHPNQLQKERRAKT